MASQLEAEVRRRRADVAELADAYGLGPYALWLGGSSPSVRTKTLINAYQNSRIKISENSRLKDLYEGRSRETGRM